MELALILYTCWKRQLQVGRSEITALSAVQNGYLSSLITLILPQMARDGSFLVVLSRQSAHTHMRVTQSWCISIYIYHAWGRRLQEAITLASRLLNKWLFSKGNCGVLSLSLPFVLSRNSSHLTLTKSILLQNPKWANLQLAKCMPQASIHISAPPSHRIIG